MGFLDRLTQPRDSLVPPTPVAVEQISWGRSLAPFGSYASKPQFMIDWAADIFRHAGRDPADRPHGVREMASIAVFTQIWFPVRAVGVDDRNRRLVAYLDSLDKQSLLPILDSIYQNIVNLAWADYGATVEAANREFGQIFEQRFVACRTEFVEGVMKGDF